MDQIELNAKLRNEKGKNVANRIRAKNEVPGILYGSKKEPVPIILSAKKVQKIISTKAGENALISLKIEGSDNQTAMIKEIQSHPVSGKLLHVDLYRISLTGEISIDVPIKITGESPGVKLGGTIEHHLREVKVKCLPMSIPESITLDISALNIGDSVHVKDLKVSGDVKITDNPEEVVLTVSIAKVEEVAPAGAAAATAEAPTGPEVIGEKEREERRAETEKTKDERSKEKQEVKQEEPKK